MRLEFSKAVDPVILYVLELLERVKSSEVPDAANERTCILGRLQRAGERIGQTEEWELTKYALVAWIDEMLTQPIWDGATWWGNNTLEFEVFGIAHAFTEFYVRAEKAASLPTKDALEVYYLCVVLGFHGMLGDSELAAQHRPQLAVDVPATLEQWAARYNDVVGGDDIAEPRTEVVRIRGAPPREGKYLFLGSWLTALFLAVLIGILIKAVWF